MRHARRVVRGLYVTRALGISWQRVACMARRQQPFGFAFRLLRLLRRLLRHLRFGRLPLIPSDQVALLIGDNASQRSFLSVSSLATTTVCLASCLTTLTTSPPSATRCKPFSRALSHTTIKHQATNTTRGRRTPPSPRRTHRARRQQLPQPHAMAGQTHRLGAEPSAWSVVRQAC